MARQHWLIKSEPNTYPYEKLVKDGRTVWDGVRNFEARNNLRAMNEGDLALFYHSNIGKEVVGVARIVKKAYPDPGAKDEDWSVVDVAPGFALNEPVTLEAMKDDPALNGLLLLTRSRLSVVPVSAAHFDHILKLGKTKLPK
ncbi:MAG TPA: EVE domain-containing protein [Polyangiaceae bacterium]|jgi:predicted RNA-binding protein with PUA-like domain